MVSSGLRVVVAPKQTFLYYPETSLSIPAACVLAAAALTCKLGWRWRGRCWEEESFPDCTGQGNSDASVIQPLV
jgi:hypothetical protein